MSDDGDPPIGVALLAALLLLGLYVFAWLLASLWVALDPLSR